MTKPKFLTRKFIESAVRFALYFLAVVLTPFFAEPLAPLFDWAGYGGLRKLFAMIFTAIFWGIEVWIFCLISKYCLRKNFSPASAQRYSEAEAAYAEANATGGRKKRRKKEPRPPVPWKNLGILTGMTVASILITSVIIDFQVKPFYDMGEKFTGFEMWITVGEIGLNAVKCIWVAFLMRNAWVMAGELVNAYLPDKKPWVRLAFTSAILSLFAIFDVFAYVADYPMGGTEWLLVIAYLVYYAFFPVAYYYAEEHLGKAYFVMVLMYTF